jgi:hypothetical protein
MDSTAAADTKSTADAPVQNTEPASAFVNEFFSTHLNAYVEKTPNRKRRFVNTIRDLAIVQIAPIDGLLSKGSTPFAFSLVYTSLAEMQKKVLDNWDESAESEENVPFAFDRYPLEKLPADADAKRISDAEYIDVLMDHTTQRMIDGACDAQFRQKKTLVFDKERPIVLCIEVE